MIRILIVDDHPVVRAGLTSMLRTYPDLEVVSGVSDGSQMLALIEKVSVDVILLDLRMPGMSGIEILQSLKSKGSPLRVIVLTSYESDDYIYEALRAGACGYLLKACSEEEMIEAIHAVYAGGRYLPQYIAARFVERVPRALLSSRQSAILEHIARGLKDHEVARKMRIGVAEVWRELSATVDLMETSETERTEDAKGRRPTMADIARKAGVSLATVSRVLHNKGMHTEETRRAVMKAVQECDFQRNDTAASLALMRNASVDY
jgi:DNA-binding NarL/FixJ family response regulator